MNTIRLFAGMDSLTWINIFVQLVTCTQLTPPLLSHRGLRLLTFCTFLTRKKESSEFETYSSIPFVAFFIRLSDIIFASFPPPRLAWFLLATCCTCSRRLRSNLWAFICRQRPGFPLQFVVPHDGHGCSQSTARCPTSLQRWQVILLSSGVLASCTW